MDGCVAAGWAGRQSIDRASAKGGTMTTQPLPPSAHRAATLIPGHWTPAQALAVFGCLQLLRQPLWEAHDPEVQQASREQFVPDGPPPGFDPGEPF
jgi:hypothetical protein